MGIICKGVATLALGVSLSSATSAQSPPPRSGWGFGAHIDGAIGGMSGTFTELPGVPTCIGLMPDGGFDGGSGGGFGVGLAAMLRPSMEGGANNIGLSLRAGIARTTTTFESDQTIGRANLGGEIVPIVDRYSVEATFSELRADLLGSYWLSAETPLAIEVGPSIGYVLSGTYAQSERILSPSNAEYTTGSTVRGESSGDLPGLKGLQIGVVGGVAWQIPVGQTLAIRPSAHGRISFTSPLEELEWKGSELRIGASILYMLAPPLSTPLENR